MRYFLALPDVKTLPANVTSSSADFVLLGVVLKNDEEEELFRQAEIIVQSSKEETPKTFEELIKEFMEDV